jgi:hypothetical protein
MESPAPTELVREYLSRMADIHGTGGATKETSYYSALENLLNQFGKQLKPQVICNGQLRNSGAGNPDFGLYTKSQVQDGEPRKGQLPERGVVEVKGLPEETWQTADSAQATKYFQRYKLVLITNYREFRLIGEDRTGKAAELDRYTFAGDEATFWSMAAKPASAAQKHATHFAEFIRRVITTAAPLVKAEDIAWFLASYAKDAFATLSEKDSSSLKPLRDALETALGIRFEGENGEHFFKSTLIQTLFYGVFSAWVVHAKQSDEHFDWKTSAFTLTVPMVKALFEQIATPSKLGVLGLMPVLDRTADALNRVSKVEFFKTFDTGAAVQHFYEPFLQAYDPELRKSLGVWYTPPEIVTYMVERVDRVLRSELGKVNGLADKDVYVLDPCCGTGTYVVAVLRKIEQTLRSLNDDDLVADDVKQASRERIFGFELLSAPFVISHWRVGNYLSEIGAPLDAAHGERAAIYLTNALTGWKPPTGAKAALPLFPELADERDAAEHVKRDVPILVVLGNPPYNAFAGTSPAEEEGLVEPYKEGLNTTWNIKKFNLDDLYVRFFRIAERRIDELGRGIVAYISNYSYVSEPSYVVMREKLLQSFDKFWIENMHGDRNKTEYSPDGKTSETIFAMRGFSPGIRQGIVITLAVKTGQKAATKIVRFRDDIDAAKADARRKQLLSTLPKDFDKKHERDFNDRYETAVPERSNRLSFRPLNTADDYKSWPKLIDVAERKLDGLFEKRGGALIDIDRQRLIDRIKSYFDVSVDWDSYKASSGALTEDAARFDAKKARATLLATESFDERRIVRLAVRPYDIRFCYYTDVRPIWNEPRPDLWKNFRAGSKFVISRMNSGSKHKDPPAYFSSALIDGQIISVNASAIPLSLHTELLGHLDVAPNLSDQGLVWLQSLYPNAAINNQSTWERVWYHALAIAYSPTYIADHGTTIVSDWPRIPLPETREALESSAAMGETLSDLLDPLSAVTGVSTGALLPHQKIFGVFTGTDLQCTAGWGRQDSKGRVNPGQGHVQVRTYTAAEKDAIQAGAKGLKISAERAFELLGPPLDVYLNDTSYWRCVPKTVWEYSIGGYHVVKKWLSYREEAILKRALTKDEIREVAATIRRIAAIALMSDELDSNYAVARANSYAWQRPN